MNDNILPLKPLGYKSREDSVNIGATGTAIESGSEAKDVEEEESPDNVELQEKLIDDVYDVNAVKP